MNATTVEVSTGHFAVVSHPGETARLITAAAGSRVTTPAGRAGG